MTGIQTRVLELDLADVSLLRRLLVEQYAQTLRSLACVLPTSYSMIEIQSINNQLRQIERLCTDLGKPIPTGDDL